jgi:creatinine amidohydrolase/Fe(II)-dependent formamide hydrolase-like protein
MDFVSFEEGYPQHLIGSMHYIPEQLYLQIIEQIIKSLKRNGFALLVAVGHGPSTGTLLQNRERLENEFDFKILSLTELCGEGPEGMAMDHAAFNETALMMSLYPELVDLSLLNDDVPPVGVWGKDPRVPGIKEEGDRLTVLYGEQASEKLIEINKSLPKPNLRLEFRHVKNLME